MQNPHLVLYYTSGACSMASHVALEESGVAFDCRSVGADGDVSKQDYLSVNPRGVVPTLLVDGAPLTESVAILGYIATLAPALMPAESWLQALCLSRMAWFASSVHIAFRQTRRPERYAGDAQAFDAIREAGHVGFRRALTEIDAHLTGRDWNVGERFSVVDAYALVFFEWGLSNGYDMGAYPAFDAFRRRCVLRPATRRALEREQSLVLRTA